MEAWRKEAEARYEAQERHEKAVEEEIQRTFNNILGLFKEYVSEQDDTYNMETWETNQDTANRVYSSFRYWLEKKL